MLLWLGNRTCPGISARSSSYLGLDFCAQSAVQIALIVRRLVAEACLAHAFFQSDLSYDELQLQEVLCYVARTVVSTTLEPLRESVV